MKPREDWGPADELADAVMDGMAFIAAMAILGGIAYAVIMFANWIV